MNSIAKKMMILSLVGILQLGIGASAIEASPLRTEDSPQIVQLHGKHRGHDKHHHHHDGDGSFVEGVIVGAVVGAVVANNS